MIVDGYMLHQHLATDIAMYWLYIVYDMENVESAADICTFQINKSKDSKLRSNCLSHSFCKKIAFQSIVPCLL